MKCKLGVRGPSSITQASQSRLLKSGLLASMYMGISPGNIGTMTYLDVYRRELPREFWGACGDFCRGLGGGVFGRRAGVLGAHFFD